MAAGIGRKGLRNHLHHLGKSLYKSPSKSSKIARKIPNQREVERSNNPPIFALMIASENESGLLQVLERRRLGEVGIFGEGHLAIDRKPPAVLRVKGPVENMRQPDGSLL